MLVLPEAREHAIIAGRQRGGADDQRRWLTCPAEALARVRSSESDRLVDDHRRTGGLCRERNSEFLGVAIMDERCRSDIHNGRSTVFRVEAGEHTVSVHIKRRFRVGGYRGRAMVSLPVVVEPGEHLDLVFGVAKDWKPLQRARILWLVLLVE